VYLEIGSKRTFASMLAWPGWSRSGRDEPSALSALVAYGPRFAAAMGDAGLSIAPPTDVVRLVVAERLEGGSGTDFGVPSRPPAADFAPLDEADLARFSLVMEGAWRAFERLARTAVGHELRKGPRGGGRDLARIIGHVIEAEEAYVVQLGGRPPRAPSVALDERLAALRDRGLEVLTARARDQPVSDASRVARPWLPRYYVRRAAWHVLDHAWEIEDRVIA
jgi:hypothetical protein